MEVNPLKSGFSAKTRNILAVKPMKQQRNRANTFTSNRNI